MARSQAQRRVDWFAAGLGLVVAVVIQLVGGTLLFGSHRGQPVSQGLLTFAALLLAGRSPASLGRAPARAGTGWLWGVGSSLVRGWGAPGGPTGRFGRAGWAPWVPPST